MSVRSKQAIAMDQKPNFRLETRSLISWFEVECNLSRTMLFRYPEMGTRSPSLRTVATSSSLAAPGPPPAFGASVFGFRTAFASGAPAFAGFATLGVRGGLFTCAGFALGEEALPWPMTALHSAA